MLDLGKRLSALIPLGLLLACLHPGIARADQASPMPSRPLSGHRIVPMEGLPPGLASAMARSGSAALPAEYRLRPRAGGYAASNPRQGFEFTFSPEGLSARREGHSLGMRLQGWGRDRVHPLPLGQASASTNRMEYRRGTAMTEWYLNSDMGLEQGFTLHQPPSASGGAPLVLELALSGSLRPRLQGDSAIEFREVGSERVQARYGGLYTYDADGKALPSRFALSPDGNRVRILVEDRGARYPVTVDPWIQKAHLMGSDSNGKDLMGYSIAIDGDTVVVGAVADGDHGTRSGAAFVFVKPGTGWANATEAAKLTASDGAAEDYFGMSVGVSGDTVVVGAYVAKVGSNAKQGAAYVFVRPAGGWAGSLNQTVKLTASDGSAGHYFGQSVAVKGSTVVVGATGASAAYLYYRSGNTWPQAAKLGPEGGYSGASVVIADDESWVASGAANYNSAQGAVFVYNKPGATWSNKTYDAILLDNAINQHNQSQLGICLAASGNVIVSGAEETASAAPGAACVFTKPGATWTGTVRPTARLTGSDVVSSSFYGAAVAISGSGDTIAVGTWGREKIYVFKKPGGGWATTNAEDCLLTNSDHTANPSCYFGNRLAMSGDTLVTGAFYWGGEQGAAYVFTKPGTGWAAGTETALLTASDGSSGDSHGYSVATDGSTAVVGAYYAKGRKGIVYVYTRPGTGWADATETARLTASDGASGDMFGNAVAISGDVILVGAPGVHAGAVKDVGKAYVFVKPGGGWANATENAQLNPSDGLEYGMFALGVGISGDTAVVSMGGATIGANTCQGAVYVFTRPGGGWSGSLNQIARLWVSDGLASDYLSDGGQLAIHGDTIVAGTYATPNWAGRGRVFVFTKPGGGWVDATQTAELAATDIVDGAYFGSAVAISGDTVAVGASGMPAGSGPGAAYVFLKPGGGWTGTIFQTAKLTPSDGVPSDNFGWAVAMSGHAIAVGASGATYDGANGLAGPGAVYIFLRPDSGWINATENARISVGGASGDQFGASVALYGGTLLAGAPGEFSNKGSAYLFTGPEVSGSAGTAGALLSMDGGTWTAVADGIGNYAFAAPNGWSGSATPSKTGYTFSPVQRDYAAITADQPSQDYVATPITYAVSGNAGAPGVTLSYTDGIARTVTSGGDGSYSLPVSYGWSGTVTPSKSGYTFSPDSLTYLAVLAPQTGQDYIATATTKTLSGSAGVAGASLSYTDGTAKTATADGSGAYSFTVSSGWSGDVIPSKAGYYFDPAKRTYSNVVADTPAEDYTATAIVLSAESQVSSGTLAHLATITAQAGASYAWSLSSGTITSGQGTPSIRYTAGDVGSRTLSCQITDAAGIVQTASRNLLVVTYTATVTSPTPVHAGTPGLAAAVPAVEGGSYAWSVVNGAITAGQGTARITYTAGSAGTAILMCTVNAKGVTTHGSKNVTVTASPAEITSASPVLAGSRGNQAWVPATTGASYLWSITNGAILSGQGTSTIVFAAGSAGAMQLECTVTLAAVPTSGTKAVEVTPYTARIAAPTTAFAGQTGLQAAVPDLSGATFTWGITNGSITSGQGSRIITFSAGAAGSLELTCDVTSAAGPAQGIKSVAVRSTSATITAESTVVAHTTPHAAHVPMQAGATYTWTIANGTLLSGQGTYVITYKAAAPGTVDLGCTVTDAGGNAISASASVAATLYTAPIVTESPVVTGSAQGASVQPVHGGSYAWSITNGTITSGQGTASITYTAGETGITNLLCAVTIGGQITYGTQNIVVQGASTDIWAPGTVQAGGQGYQASVPRTAGASYAWSASNGTITAGQGTRTATFTAGDSGTLELECIVTIGGTPHTGTKSVAVTAYAATIVDPRVLYAGETNNMASVVPLAGASYAWTITNGTITSGQGTPSIRYTAGVEGTLGLQCLVDAGIPVTGSSTVTVKAGPASITTLPSLLAGTSSHGAGVPRLAVGTYAWTITNGTITSGQGTANILFTAGSEGSLDLSCVVTTPDGIPVTGSRTIPVLTYCASALVAASPVEAGAPNLKASLMAVEGATYAWTLTNGTITSGQGTPSLTYTAGGAGTTVLLCEVAVGGARTFVSRSVAVLATGSSIQVAATVQAGGQGYKAYVPARAGATYLWSITNGTLTAGQGSSAVTFTAGTTGSLQLECTVTVGGLPESGARTLNVVPYSGAITCQIPVHAGQAGVVASVPGLDGATYAWTVTNGTLTSANGDRMATFTAGTEGTLLLTCDVITAGTVTGSLGIPVFATGATIQAEATVRAASSSHRAYVPVQGGSSYTWSIANGTLTGGQGTPQVTYTAGDAGPLDLDCRITSPDGTVTTGSRTVTVH